MIAATSTRQQLHLNQFGHACAIVIEFELVDSAS